MKGIMPFKRTNAKSAVFRLDGSLHKYKIAVILEKRISDF